MISYHRFHSNYGPILYCFPHIARCWLKIANCIPPLVFNAPWSEFRKDVYNWKKNYNERATTVEESMMIMLAISIQYRSVTDERKDGRTELLYQLSRIAVLTRDKISAVQGTTDIPPWSLHSLVFTQRKSDHWRGSYGQKRTISANRIKAAWPASFSTFASSSQRTTIVNNRFRVSHSVNNS